MLPPPEIPRSPAGAPVWGERGHIHTRIHGTRPSLAGGPENPRAIIMEIWKLPGSLLPGQIRGLAPGEELSGSQACGQSWSQHQLTAGELLSPPRPQGSGRLCVVAEPRKRGQDRDPAPQVEGNGDEYFGEVTTQRWRRVS